MKRINLLMASVFMLVVTSCTKDQALTPNPNFVDDNNAVAADNGEVRAILDGDAFLSSTAGASRIGGLMNVTGVSGNLTLTMTMTQDFGVGEYSLDDPSNVIALSNSNNNMDSHTSNRGHSNAGTIRILSIDETNKRIDGTFDAVLRDSNNDEIVVTNGEINNVSYVTNTSTGVGNNLFSAEIDGSPWTPESITGVLNGGKLGVSGLGNSPAQSIILFLPENVQSGTFDLMPFGDYDAQFHVGSGVNTKIYAVDNGTVTINSHNTSAKNVKGSFSFNASEAGSSTAGVVSITNGSFDVDY